MDCERFSSESNCERKSNDQEDAADAVVVVPLEAVVSPVKSPNGAGQVNAAFVNDEESLLSNGNKGHISSDANGQCECCKEYGLLVEQLKIYYPSVASKLCSSEKEEPVKVIWKNLTVEVDVASSYLPWKGKIHKKILQPMNGVITAGSLTALMGPSGAGKTTLLNCICGKLTQGVLGDRTIKVPKSEQNSIRIGFVPQHDALFTQFTIRETVLFASKLTNVSLSKHEHQERVESILNQLALTKFAEQKTSQISGGQLKRTCIAVELISNPKILILDEPTTGLDSSNAENVISLLKSVVKRAGKLAPAIVATIHQPSYDLFEMFDSIYLLSKNGANIYTGPPSEIMNFFQSFGFERKTNVNPADYAIEIANAKYGYDKFDQMKKFTYSQTDQEQIGEGNNGYAEIKIDKFEQKVATSFFKQFYMLTSRSFNAYMIKSSLMVAKLVLNLALSFFLCVLFDEPVGTLRGCWTEIIMPGKPNYTDETEAMKESMIVSFETNQLQFDQTRNITKMVSATNFIFVMLMYYMFSFSVSAVLTIPNELKVVSKEISNSWYGVPAYYGSKMLTDFVFFIFTAIIPLAYAFWASEQEPEIWRCVYFIIFVFLLTASWEARGSIVGTLCTFDQIVAITVDIGLMFPIIFLSGFFVREAKLADFLKPMTAISDLKYAFRGILLTLYGFSRCTRGEVVEGIFDQLEDEVTTFRMFNIMWSSLNITESEMRRFEKVLNMEDKFLDPMYEALTNNYGESSVGIWDKPDYQASYVLDNNDINESMYQYSLGYSLVNLLVLKLLILPILYVKTKVSRL